MRLQLQIAVAALLFASSAPLSAHAGNCAKCGVVAPAGWKLCQRCKNEKDRLDREEARKKRRAEAEEAQRKKDAAERAAKLRKLLEAKTSPDAPAAAPAAAAATPPAAKPSAEAKPLAEACPGLFGIKFGQATDAAFSTKTVVEEGRPVLRHFFTPERKFRGFEEYSVRVGASGVYEITAHRRYVKGAGLDAKQAANAEFDDCAKLLGMKFGKPMVQVEESLSGRASQIRFVSPEGLVCRTVTVRMARDMDSALANRYDDNSDSLMMEMDRIYDVWIVATDNIGLLRERRAKESSDLDAL